MRLTKYWTRTTEEAYGMSGMKGRYGELIVAKLLEEQHIPVKDYEEVKAKQKAGIDIEAGKHTIDVKSNLEDGVFFIEVNSTGWLFDPRKTSDVIVHIDVASNDIVWYHRKDAQAKIICNDSRPLLKITPSNFRSDFMSTSHALLYALLKS